MHVNVMSVFQLMCCHPSAGDLACILDLVNQYSLTHDDSVIT